MKKVLTISLLLVLVLTCATTVVRAATTTEADLQKKVLEILSKVKTEVDYTATVERVFKEYDFTEEQLGNAMEKLDEIEATVVTYGEDPKAYKEGVREYLVELAQATASDLGMKLTVDSKNNVATLTRNGSVVVALDTETGKIKQTGSDNLVFVVLAGVAVIAVVTTAVVKKARANA